MQLNIYKIKQQKNLLPFSVALFGSFVNYF